MERAIERMGWPEIHGSEAELFRGQDIHEDAGGDLMRAIRALFGLPPKRSRMRPTAMRRVASSAGLPMRPTPSSGTSPAPSRPPSGARARRRRCSRRQPRRARPGRGGAPPTCGPRPISRWSTDGCAGPPARGRPDAPARGRLRPGAVLERPTARAMSAAGRCPHRPRGSTHTPGRGRPRLRGAAPPRPRRPYEGGRSHAAAGPPHRSAHRGDLPPVRCKYPSP